MAWYMATGGGLIRAPATSLVTDSLTGTAPAKPGRTPADARRGHGPSTRSTSQPEAPPRPQNGATDPQGPAAPGQGPTPRALGPKRALTPPVQGPGTGHPPERSTNISKDMCARNRPNFNTDSGLTPNGGGADGVSPGSAPKGNVPRSPRASRPAIRGVFAPGTPASAAAAPGGSGGPPADVDELAATLGRPSRAAGVAEPSRSPAATPAAGVETEALSRPGTAAAGPGVEPDAQPARRGQRRVTRRVDVLADVARANPFTPPARRPGCPPGAEDLQVPAKPRWLLSIPDAISQLEQLDRTLLTRRDVERLFGVSKARAATLMQTFGAELVGNQRTLPRTKLLQQLKKHRGRAAFRGEEERRARLVAELQQARLTGVRFKVPAETMSAKLANLPEGVSVRAAGSRCGSTGRRTPWRGSTRWRRRSGTTTCGSRSSSVRGAGGGEVVTE